MRVMCVEHVGSYMMIGKAFDTLFAQLGASNLLGTQAPRLVGIYYDEAAYRWLYGEWRCNRARKRPTRLRSRNI